MTGVNAVLREERLSSIVRRPLKSKLGQCALAPPGARLVRTACHYRSTHDVS